MGLAKVTQLVPCVSPYSVACSALGIWGPSVTGLPSVSPPELPSSEHLSVADATWLALNVVSGGGSFSSSQPIGVTKIAKSVIAPLADQNISVFMLSTYQTDFILVTAALIPHRHCLQSSVVPVL